MRMVTMLEDVLLDGNTVCVLPINVVSMRAVTIKSHPLRFYGMHCLTSSQGPGGPILAAPTRTSLGSGFEL
jgi:hypothetical protein